MLLMSSLASVDRVAQQPLMVSTSSVTMERLMACSLGPSKGGCPDSSTYRITPRLQTSHCGSGGEGEGQCAS
jgi:hypothetical protein